MKPVVNHKKCFADPKICTAKTACPVNAIGFVKVKEPMYEKEITDKFDRCPMGEAGLFVDLVTPDWNWEQCECGPIGTYENPIPAGNPYLRVVIDYDKCTYCGICVEGCCGYAIEMVDDDVEVEDYNYSASTSETKSCCGCACANHP